MGMLLGNRLFREAGYKPLNELVLPPAVIIEVNGEDWEKGVVKKPYTPGEVLPYISLRHRLKLSLNVLLRGKLQ